MLIDWFTVGAQTVNFLVLVWLLKLFLYKPILDAIDKREKRIADELADADRKKQEAKSERDEFAKKNQEFDQQRNELLTKATDEVKTKRQQLLDEARRDADALRTKRQESLKREVDNLQAELARRTSDEVFAIAKQALSELAGADLEARMCDVFLDRLRGLNDDVKKAVHESKVSEAAPAVVRSSLDLAAEQQEAIQATLNEVFATKMHVRFETNVQVVSGIELTIGGKRFAWSIGDYIASLQKNVNKLLDDNTLNAVDAETRVAQ